MSNDWYTKRWAERSIVTNFAVVILVSVAHPESDPGLARMTESAKLVIV